jgi:hydrogenase maturation protease
MNKRYKPKIVNDPGTLIIGIGNAGRTDDGLGWAFLEAVEHDFLGSLVWRYQLQIEDADLIRNANQVLMVDATRESVETGFYWKKVLPVSDPTFTSHSLSPGMVGFLCQVLYERSPEILLLAIAGSDWELHNGLSLQGRRHLDLAVSSFRSNLATLPESKGTPLLLGSPGQ